MVELVLQPLDTNADFVVLVEWLVGDGEHVQSGAPVCLVETSKATVEITAPGTGVLSQRARVGDTVAVGTAFAAVLDSRESSAVSALPQPAALSAGEERVSRKARALMQEQGISLDEFESEGFVTLAAVERRLAERQRAKQAVAGGIFPLLEDLDTRGVTFPDGASDIQEGMVEQAFVEQLRRDIESFRRAPEHERVLALKNHGASIGTGVHLGVGTALVAPQIVLRDGVSIADGGSVWCAERFVMGQLSRFGPNLNVRCQHAIIGAGVQAENDIIIGGGGHRDPWAVIAIGDDSYLGGWLFLNTCRPILVGRNVFITNRATLLTHNIGHSYIDGYENRFAPVVLEDASQIGINTVVYPGARVGRGSVVGSNGYVIDSVPAGKVALGVPARVVGDAHRPLSRVRREGRAQEMLADLRKLLIAKGHHVHDATGAEEENVLRLTHAGGEFGLVLRASGALGRLAQGVSWIVWALDPPAGEPHDGVVVMDLDEKRVIGKGEQLWTETVREYLRKRGIKLQPGPWRYGGGLI